MSTPNPTESSSNKAIAIIGAGMSGLACAQALVEAGHCVHVFDKSRGPSGRMSTRRSSDGDIDWQCDHGAQYFTAHHAEFRKQVSEWQQAGAAQVWQGLIGKHDGYDFAPQDSFLERFVGTPRMTSPAAHMVRDMHATSQSVRFQWQATVEPLQPRSAFGWILQSQEHGTEPRHYEAVVLAVPAPQAASLLASVAPDATALASNARMLPCWALMVRCHQPLSLPVDGCFVEHSPLRWIARDSSKPSRGGTETWLLHAAHSWSEAHLEDDAATVTAALLHAFAQLGGPDPANVQATAHRWRYADTANPLNAGAWWDAAAGLGMCGDWMHSGSVEGAWLSGRSLARHVHTALHAHAG